MSGLKLRSVECALRVNRTLRFNRVAPVSPLVSATVRGLAGTLLTSLHPEFTRRWFKPGQGNHRPAAFLIETLAHQVVASDLFPFRIRTWDPVGDLLPALVEALKQAPGRPFGDGGARVESVLFGEIQEGLADGENICCLRQPTIEFLTPLRLKASCRFLDEREVTLGHLTEAAVRRLNRLSLDYGNRSTLAETPLLAASAKVRETTRSLCWERVWRHSSSQNTYIDLSGVAGRITFAELPTLLTELLRAASVVHIGHKTAEGCGQFRLS
ncbi:MAG TPA: CRISPR system precrRNA processing endoribonuclease RAMP protein Cas6 [Verrucomicrobiota bacterium]|nr:CRISPR system precrRNA processing endoribonuclease RAMP protein Cas6 [Verrucomicrobiota bacterium]